MGSKITRLTPMQGFCAETGGAITLFAATWLGIPVSTTHTITGAIIGVGAARRMSAVRWNVANNIVVAWVITIPASAAIAACFYWVAGCSSNALRQGRRRRPQSLINSSRRRSTAMESTAARKSGPIRLGRAHRG